MTAHDIFQMLNPRGEERVGTAEFRRLFNLLDLSLSEGQKEQLFAYVDVDGSGFISEDEFEQGWEELCRAFQKQYLGSLSNADVDPARPLCIIVSGIRFCNTVAVS